MSNLNEFIAKIEGHGTLHIDWRKSEVRLKVLEGERLFEGMLVGRSAEEAAWITSRICGICPVAHNIASLKAVEGALGIIPNRTTLLLRELMLAGQILQSHVLHLFFLALPDYIGLDRGTELAKKDPGSFKMALTLKEISDEIVFLVGGRSVHPVTTTPGGFHKIPEKQSLKKLLEKLKTAKEAAQKTVRLFSSLPYPELKVDLGLAAQEKDFVLSVSSTKVGKIQPKKSLIKNYKRDFQEEVKNYSTAKFARYQRKEVLVGALARVAVYQDYEKKYKKMLDFQNPYHNNFAQAVEIFQFHRKAQALLEELLKIKLDPKIIQPSSSPPFKGIGAVEAPRGGLYHEIHLNHNKTITYANILTPTVQNLSSIEKSAQALLGQTKNRSQKERQRLLEMLVRAYDPCITCAVH